VLEKYRELDIEVRGRSEHCIDLISEMRKELVYFPSTRWDVDVSPYPYSWFYGYCICLLLNTFTF
jgi:hypothetical protein